MVEPKKYKVREKISNTAFIHNGFTPFMSDDSAGDVDSFILRRVLYKGFVYLSIIIDRSNSYMIVNVQDNMGFPYSPFYNPNDRHDNKVYEDVARRYNQIMDNLVRNKILSYEEEERRMSQAIEIKVKKLNENAKIPTRGSEYAAGYDLYACLDNTVTIRPNETVKIGTGLSMELPDGYFGGIYARSGLATKQGLRPANCVGVCDSDYRGEYIVALHNDSDVERRVENGDKIAQLILRKYETMDFTEVDELSETGRGGGGFGSTGK